MTSLYANVEANNARLDHFLAPMQATAEDPKAAEPFGMDFAWRFPYSAAWAYAHLPAVREAYAKVAAWAYCRHKWRTSRNFQAKAKMTEGYVAAWEDYCLTLLDVHLDMWLDVGTKRPDPMRAAHAAQATYVREAHCVPTPDLAHKIDVLRGNGSRLITDLAGFWSHLAYLESDEAKAIVEAMKAEMEPASAKARRLRWEAAKAAQEVSSP